MEKATKLLTHKTPSNMSDSSDLAANDPAKQPFAWRRRFFESNDFKKFQDTKVKEILNIPEHNTPHPARQDASKPPSVETRDWYDFHFPTGVVLVPYAFSNVSTSLVSAANNAASQTSKQNSHSRKKGSLNSISISNYRKIQELRRGDRVILPEDPELQNYNKGIVPKGVVIINRVGFQEGTNYPALQIRTFTQLLLYEFVIPPHIRVLHVVETETCLMEKVSPNLPLPGYFTLQHAYLLEMELDYHPTADDIKTNSRAPLYKLECAFLSLSGAITKQKFIAAETVHSAVNRLHVSWHVGQKSRDTDFVKSNKWLLWLLRYTPSALSNSARRREESWAEAETYQILGWSTSGVMATGCESLGTLQITELLAPFKHHEEEMFKVLATKQ